MKVGSLGFAGSGKTTYLGALTLSLLQGDSTSDLVLFSFDGVDTTRDLTQFADQIQKGYWPARTQASKVSEYTLRLRRRETVFSLRIPELPGELLEAVWKTDHIPAQLSFLADYDAYLLLIDPLQDDLDGALARHVHLLQGIKRAKGLGRDALAETPVAIVFTKWDAVADEDRALGAQGFAEEILPLLTDFVASNFKANRFFAISAVGATDGAGSPLLQDERIRPAGIFEPLEWLAAEQS